MYTYKCLDEFLEDENLSLARLIKYYISYVSVFYCIDIPYDTFINDKVIEIQNYIDGKIGD